MPQIPHKSKQTQKNPSPKIKSNRKTQPSELKPTKQKPNPPQQWLVPPKDKMDHFRVVVNFF